MKRLVAILLVVLVARISSAAEEHVDSVVKEVLAAVAKLKAGDPQAVPLAFWDFDGTIIKGDVSEGLKEEGVERYKGLIESSILAGWCATYRGEAGWRQYRDRDYPRLNELGRYIAWPFNAQLFAGVYLPDFNRFCQQRFRDVYRHWYFASSVEIMKRLEAAGVENHVVSASPEIFVKNAAESLGLPPARLNAIRVGIDGGYVTTRLEYPLPFGEGKVEVVRRIANARPHAYALAAFGNSYQTDGAFMRYVVSQRNLPGGASGFALMINGFEPLPGYKGLFRCVRQTATMEF